MMKTPNHPQEISHVSELNLVIEKQLLTHTRNHFDKYAVDVACAVLGVKTNRRE